MSNEKLPAYGRLMEDDPPPAYQMQEHVPSMYESTGQVGPDQERPTNLPLAEFNQGGDRMDPPHAPYGGAITAGGNSDTMELPSVLSVSALAQHPPASSVTMNSKGGCCAHCGKPAQIVPIPAAYESPNQRTIEQILAGDDDRVQYGKPAQIVPNPAAYGRPDQRTIEQILAGDDDDDRVQMVSNKPPANYLWASAITFLCCIWCIGIAALHYSWLSKCDANEGKMGPAKKNGMTALQLNILNLFFGMIVWTIFILNYGAGLNFF